MLKVPTSLLYIDVKVNPWRIIRRPDGLLVKYHIVSVAAIKAFLQLCRIPNPAFDEEFE